MNEGWDGILLESGWMIMLCSELEMFDHILAMI
jgi:hypothetical protein